MVVGDRKRARDKVKALRERLVLLEEELKVASGATQAKEQSFKDVKAGLEAELREAKDELQAARVEKEEAQLRCAEQEKRAEELASEMAAFMDSVAYWKKNSEAAVETGECEADIEAGTRVLKEAGENFTKTENELLQNLKEKEEQLKSNEKLLREATEALKKGKKVRHKLERQVASFDSYNLAEAAKHERERKILVDLAAVETSLTPI